MVHVKVRSRSGHLMSPYLFGRKGPCDTCFWLISDTEHVYGMHDDILDTFRDQMTDLRSRSGHKRSNFRFSAAWQLMHVLWSISSQ